jgi:N-acyl-phosphatidylethanolamine-hydrolysing phospholipase D
MPLPVHTHAWHDTRHHVPGVGFRNPWPLAQSEDDMPGRRQRAQFFAEFFFGRKEQTASPLARPDPALLASPVGEGEVRVTWLGHSTVLVQFPGVTVLTDPVWASRVGPLGVAGPKRQVPPPLALADLPPVHLVLLSHDHYDHLDPPVLRALHARHRPHFLVPLGVDSRLPSGADVTVLDWGQYTETHGLRVHCAPARHFSGRTLTDRNTTLWASYFLQPLSETAPSVYFAGDSGYAPHFHAVREHLGAPDLVLMPIGAYRPRWMMRPVHVDPPEAVQAFEDLQAGALVPIHWGTYDLAEEPLHEAPDSLLAEATTRGLSARMHVLPAGGHLVRAATSAV